MTYKGLKRRINKEVMWPLRRRINGICHSWLKDSDITILSQNCIGGVVSHTFNMPFNTPTINMFFSAEDFLKLCENIDYYMSLQHVINEDLSKQMGHIVTNLGDLTVFGVHYHDFESFCSSWNRRKSRINKEKILIIMTDRDGFRKDLLPRISSLPYKKILYSYKAWGGHNYVVKVPKDPNQDTCCSVTDFYKITGLHICEKYTNYLEIFKGY